MTEFDYGCQDKILMFNKSEGPELERGTENKLYWLSVKLVSSGSIPLNKNHPGQVLFPPESWLCVPHQPVRSLQGRSATK